jgi:hypothetical protein
MTTYGYFLSSDEFTPAELRKQGQMVQEVAPTLR